MGDEGGAPKTGYMGLGTQGMSGLVPGQTLWRTRVRHEHTAAEKFNESWTSKTKKHESRIPDADYKDAMSTLSGFRDEIRAMQAASMPKWHGGPRPLPDRPCH